MKVDFVGPAGLAGFRAQYQVYLREIARLHPGAKLVLSQDPGALAILGTILNFRALAGIEPGNKTLGRIPSLRFGLPDDDVNAQAKVDRAAVLRREGAHALHRGGDPFLGLGPHEEDIAVLRAQILRGG